MTSLPAVIGERGVTNTDDRARARARARLRGSNRNVQLNITVIRIPTTIPLPP